jgi:hypothetical protein
MRRFVLPSVVIAAAFAAGCAARADYSGSVSNEGYGPDLVYAAPGVQVIADYDEPIFFTDGFYWRFDGGSWYRSGSYTGGWAFATPPAAVTRIDRPRDYVHYRPQGWVARSPQRQQPTLQAHREVPRTESRPIESRPIESRPMQVAPQRRQEAPPQHAAPAQHAPTRAAPQPSHSTPAPRHENDNDHRK